MNKFTVAEIQSGVDIDENKPVLYKLYFGGSYYLHKGKRLKDSYNKLLDDVFRGLRGKKCDERYSNIINICMKYPSLHKVSVELISNDIPKKIIKLEKALYKKMQKDELSLNRTDLEPYTPEWMLKEDRCTQCVIAYWTGISMMDKLVKANFCPKCGRLNKK